MMKNLNKDIQAMLMLNVPLINKIVTMVNVKTTSFMYTTIQTV